MEIGDTFGFLLGTWDVTVLTDHRCRTRGSFGGTADVTEARTAHGAPRGRARYEEVGELRFGTYVGRAHRCLDVFVSHDATAALCFTDGRPYVDLDLRGGAWHTLHLCGDDRYEITTLAQSPHVLIEHWHVRGPRTDYDARTTFRRVQ